MATTTVHVEESAPSASLSVFSDLHDHAAVAGQPATVYAYSARTVEIDFPPDGDGTYELDKGATSEFQTTLSAGTHVLGVRITDTRGGVVEQRITTFVYQSADAFGDKAFPYSYENTASVGQPADLSVWMAPYTFVYTIEWDADGDGDFDDGTFDHARRRRSVFEHRSQHVHLRGSRRLRPARAGVAAAGLRPGSSAGRPAQRQRATGRPHAFIPVVRPPASMYGGRTSLGLTALSRFGIPR